MRFYNTQFMDVHGDTPSSVHTHETFATLDIGEVSSLAGGCVTFYGATTDDDVSNGTKLVVSLTSLELMLETALDKVKAEIAATYEGMHQ